MNSLISIPFKCPYGEFSCDYVDTLIGVLNMDCNKCECKINYKMEKKLTYRTYQLVLRQLSPINKAVQAEHSAKRYIWKYRNDNETAVLFDPDCPDNETTIIVDGGTHQEMVEIQHQLEESGIKHSYFNEPDLNNCLTAITVIADERVWDRMYFQSYENFENYFGENVECEDFKEPCYAEWLTHIGGEKNAKLIELLAGKRLSQV